METKYQSDLLGSIHETAAGLYRIGAISDAEMLEFDEDCLAENSVPIHAAEKPIGAIFERQPAAATT